MKCIVCHAELVRRSKMGPKPTRFCSLHCKNVAWGKNGIARCPGKRDLAEQLESERINRLREAQSAAGTVVRDGRVFTLVSL